MLVKRSAGMFLVGLSFVVASCSSDDKNADPAPATQSTPTPTETETTSSTATASLQGGAQVMGAIKGALASIPGTLLLDGSALNLESKASGNPRCTEHGEPLKKALSKSKGDSLIDSDRMDVSDKDYAATLFLCLATLTPKDGASVETLLGSLAQIESVLCSFEKGFGTFDYKTGGNKLIASGETKTIALSSECWPNGAPEGITSVNFDSATATLLDAASGYEKELSFASSEMGLDYKLQFFNKDGIIGFRTIDTGVAPGIGGYAEMVLNAKTGVILVNTVDDRNGGGGADSAYRRVIRMKVTGELDATALSFKSLKALQGIRFNSGANLDQYSAATVKGDKDTGFYAYTALNNDTFAETYKGCTGANTDCTATGLPITAANAASFYSSRTEWATQLASGLPPCDDGKDIDLTAVPASGAFGVCK